MAPMSLTEDLAQQLLDIAKSSINHGLANGKTLKIDVSNYPATLREHRATFVTLNKNRQLRGCIGMLEAVRPLAEDVAENAFSAAFRDPRFPPLIADELDELDIYLSLLTPAEALTFTSEADLLAQLKPGLDGLILKDGKRRGTFLPTVWENLPEPSPFLRHLKQKAGFAPDYWSDTIQFYRYRTEIIK